MKSDQEKQIKKNNNKMIMIIVCVLLFMIMAAVIIVLVLKLRSVEGDTDKDKDNVYVIDENNYLQIAEDMKEEVREGYFETYMNTEWIFENGTAVTENAVLGNSPNNAKPIRCEVILNDTREKVLTTGVIPVGAELPPFSLDVDLDAGVYEATCIVYLLNENEDGTYADYSSAGFRVTIHIKN